MMKHLHRYPLVLASWLALTVVLGCGQGKATVSGRVTRPDGSPVVGARIILRGGDSKSSARGVTDDEGRYALGTIDKDDGVYPGSYSIVVVENRGDLDSAQPRTIAARYERPETSGLSLDVKSRETKVLDLVLDPK